MATIGSIAVSLRADPKKFVTGMNRAKKSVRDFTRAVPGLNMVFSRTGALLSGLAAGGLAAFVRSQANAIDETAKLADRIGITTERLVGLQHAANITGAGANLLNRSLDVMTKRIGEAAQGTGEAKQALDVLGLSVGELLALDPAQQFDLIADRVSRLGSQQEKAAVTSDLFSRAGLKLLNTLELGSAGIQRMQKDAERLGLTFSEIDAIKVQQANDALTRAGSAIQGIGRTLAIELAPFVEAAASAFADWASEGTNATDLITNGIEGVVKAMGFLKDVANVVIGVFQAFGSFVSGIIFKLIEAFGRLLQLAELVVPSVKAAREAAGVDDFAKDIAEFGGEAAARAEKLFKDAFDRIGDGLGGGSSDKAARFFNKIRRDAERAAEKIRDAARAKKGLVGGEPAPGDKSVANAAAIASSLSSAHSSQASLTAGVEAELRARRAELEGLESQRDLERDMQIIQELMAAGRMDLLDQFTEILEKEKEAAKIAKDREEHEKRDREIKEQQRAAQRALENKKATRRELDREVELLKAANEFERDRLRLKHDLEDLVRRLGDDQEAIRLAEEAHKIKMADLAAEEADAIKKKAEAEKEATDEMARGLQLAKRATDITKTFANFGGTSLFGFGRGSVGSGLGSIAGAAAAANKGATGLGGASGAGGGSAGAGGSVVPPQLEDLSPEVLKAREMLEKMPPLWDRLADAAESMAKQAEAAHRKTNDRTADAVRTLADAQKRLEENDRRLERQLNEALSGLGK